MTLPGAFVTPRHGRRMIRLGISILLLFAIAASAAQQTIDDIGTFSTPKDMMGAIDDNFSELYSASSNTIIIGNESASRVELPVATSTVIGRGASGAIDDLNEATFKALFNLESGADFLGLSNTTEFTPDADYEPATKKYVDDLQSISSNTIIIGDESAQRTELSVTTSTVIGRGASGAIDDMNEATFKTLFNLESGVDFLGLGNTTEFTPDADYEPATKKYVDERGTDFDDIGDASANGTIDVGTTTQIFTFGTGSAMRFQGEDSGDYWEFVQSAGNVILRPVGGATAQFGTIGIEDAGTGINLLTSGASATVFAAIDTDTGTDSPLIRAYSAAVPYGTLGGATNRWKYDTDGNLEPEGSATIKIPNGTSGTTDETGKIYLDTDGDGGTNFSNPMVQLSTNGATLGYLFPLDIPTTDNYIMKYDSSTKKIGWEADVEGDSVSVDGTGVVNPDFVSSGDIDFVNISNSITANINADSIVAGDFADGDLGDMSVSSNTISIDDDAVQPDDIEYVVEEVFIPVSYMINGASAPDALATITSGTGKTNVRTFAGDADEDLLFEFAIPSDMDTTSGLKFQVVTYITASTGPSAETYQFEMQGFSMGNGDALDGTMGTAQSSNSGSRSDAQYDRVVTEWSAAMTSSHITDLTAGETVILKLYRDVDDTDTYAQLVGVSGINIRYKRNLTTTF